MHERRSNESLMDYEERLYKNRVEYGLSWNDLGKLLLINQHPDNIRKASYGYLRRCDQEHKNIFDKSIMIINDLHLPYERKDVLEIIRKHNNEITALVIGGDLMDCHSISFYPKIEEISLDEELIYTYNFIKEVRNILNNGQKIILINGNHEERLYKEICNMHQKNLQKFINPNILSMLVDGFTLYKDDKKTVYKGIDGLEHISHWFINIDDKVIVAHPKDFSRVKGKMLENVASHFINRGEEFEVIVFGHTHKYSSGIVDRYASKYIVENFCLCNPQDYADRGKLGYSPQAYGYTIIKYNNNELIDKNNIKSYFLDDVMYENQDKYIVNL